MATNSGTGTVAVVVTDAATDEFLQIWVTVRKVELIGSQGHFTLFEGRRVIDLLSMRDDARLLSLGREVPAGEWSKIRLHVEDVRLIRLVAESDAGTIVECPPDVTPDPGFVCESIRPKVGGNGKIDLNPRGPITVRPGELVFVQLDLDAQKSIHIHETGNERFIFRPVVFVDLFAGAPGSAGADRGHDRGDRSRGAEAARVRHASRVPRQRAAGLGARSRCVDVRVGAETSIFGFDGQPAALADLAVGDEIAAVGRFRVGTGETLVFDALWIQQGGFDAGIAVTGEVLTRVVGGEFTIAPDPEGPIAVDELTVRLLPGAKLFNRAGESLAPSDLRPGMRVRVFGVLAGSDPERLDASLVFVRARADLARLHGTVTQRFDAAAGTLVIQAVTPTSRRAGLRGDRERRRRVPDRRSGRSAALRSHRAGRSPGGRGSRRVRPSDRPVLRRRHGDLVRRGRQLAHGVVANALRSRCRDRASAARARAGCRRSEIASSTSQASRAASRRAAPSSTARTGARSAASRRSTSTDTPTCFPTSSATTVPRRTA